MDYTTDGGQEMIKKQNFKHLACYFACFLTAIVLMLALLANQSSQAADPYACIRQDLNARWMSGNIPDPHFSISYEVPSCYQNAGYRPTEVRISNGRIVVKYEK